MPARARVLILGGTAEARHIAEALAARGLAVILSLAGATVAPAEVSVETRRGGFGGAAGLADFLRSQSIATLIDATHPFALRISENAAAAAAMTGISLTRFERPCWQAAPGDLWIAAESVGAAASLLPAGARVFATIGRNDIGLLFARAGIGGVARMIEAPVADVPVGWQVIRARPPFAVAEEGRLMDRHRFTHVVAKNAGGSDTYAKIVAARERKIPVVMVQRPRKPGNATATQVSQLADEVAQALSA